MVYSARFVFAWRTTSMCLAEAAAERKRGQLLYGCELCLECVELLICGRHVTRRQDANDANGQRGAKKACSVIHVMMRERTQHPTPAASLSDEPLCGLFNVPLFCGLFVQMNRCADAML
jgi:hypothetical protein